MKRLAILAVNAAHAAARRIMRALEPVSLAVLPAASPGAARIHMARGTRAFVELKRIVSAPNRRPDDLMAAHARTLRHLDLAAADDAQYTAHRLASTAHFLVGDASGFLARLRAFYNARAAFAASRQLDRLGIRFIPSGPLMRTIGNTAVYESLVKCRTLNGDPSSLILLYDGREASRFVNRHLLTYWRQHMAIIDDPETWRRLAPLVTPLGEDDGGPFLLDGEILPTHSALALATRRWEEEGRAPIFSLRDEDRARGLQALERFGFGAADWFACLHVREGRAKGNEPFRQAGINDYIPAIKAVTDRGGWVIRLGIGGPPLPDMERVIDYANSPIRSDWMDVFLCGACRFFIGTSSGMYTVAHAFGRPVVQTNYLPTSTLYMGNRNLFLPKLARRRDSGEMLSFADLMGPPFNIAANDAVLDDVLGVQVVDNTPDELREVVEEMMHRLDAPGPWTDDAEASRLQARFNDLTAAAGTLVGLPGVPLTCRIGTAFLRRHQSLLPPEEINVDSQPQGQCSHA